MRVAEWVKELNIDQKILFKPQWMLGTALGPELVTRFPGFPISLLMAVVRGVFPMRGALGVGDGQQPATSGGSSLYQLMSTYWHQGFPNSVTRVKGGGGGGGSFYIRNALVV